MNELRKFKEFLKNKSHNARVGDLEMTVDDLVRYIEEFEQEQIDETDIYEDDKVGH